VGVFQRMSWWILYLTIILLIKTGLRKNLLCTFFLLVFFENVLRTLNQFIRIILITIYSWFKGLYLFYWFLLIAKNLFYNWLLIKFNIIITIPQIVVIFQNEVYHMFIWILYWLLAAEDFILIAERYPWSWYNL
jgi:hypothetical protein